MIFICNFSYSCFIYFLHLCTNRCHLKKNKNNTLAHSEVQNQSRTASSWQGKWTCAALSCYNSETRNNQERLKWNLQRGWPRHSHQTPIKNQTTTRTCIGNIYIWKFPIDTWGLDYNLFTVSDFKKKRERERNGLRKKETSERGGWGSKGRGERRGEKETYVHRRRHVGCSCPGDTTATLVHKQQRRLTFRWAQGLLLFLEMHNPPSGFSKLKVED